MRAPDRLPEVQWGTQGVQGGTDPQRIICDTTLKHCVAMSKGDLKAIVLTGSMSRGEASIVREADYWTVLGDAEFMVVFNDGLTLPSAGTLQRTQQRIEADLLTSGIKCSIDLTSVHSRYFRKLPPHIFSYELKHCGRVIWGEDDILQIIPSFSANQIALEDAWRLLTNRLLEMLECTAELSDELKEPSESLQYKIIKLYLDMNTSFLVFARAYAPSYRERRDCLRALASRERAGGEYPFRLGKFADLVAYCTDLKCTKKRDAQAVVLPSWNTAVKVANSLWRWELTQLTGVDYQLTDRDLLEKWIRMQPFSQRVRGWAYVLRARGWFKSYRDWPHWLKLCWRSSPRYSIYLAATILIFDLAAKRGRPEMQSRGQDWTSLSNLLPVRKSTSDPRERTSKDCLAQDIIWNWKQFLVGTRS